MKRQTRRVSSARIQHKAEVASTSGGPARIAGLPTTSYPAEGGTWHYGNWAFYIHSDYAHDTRNHGSSCVLNGTPNRSIDTIAGQTSYSQVPCPTDFPWENNQDEYYYRVL